MFQEIKKQTKNTKRETERILSHYALGIERQTYQSLFTIGEITEERFVALNDSILRQIDFLEHNILPEERKATFQVAPNVPKFTCWQTGWLSKLCPTSWLKFIFKSYRKSKIIDRMIHYRARRIASWRVLRDFKSLQKNHDLFQHSHTIAKIIKRYEGWNKNSEAKIAQMEKLYPKTIMKERLRMAEQECLKREHKIEREFFEKGFLNQKVFLEMEEAVEQREGACRRKGLFRD